MACPITTILEQELEQLGNSGNGVSSEPGPAEHHSTQQGGNEIGNVNLPDQPRIWYAQNGESLFGAHYRLVIHLLAKSQHIWCTHNSFTGYPYQFEWVRTTLVRCWPYISISDEALQLAAIEYLNMTPRLRNAYRNLTEADLPAQAVEDRVQQVPAPAAAPVYPPELLHGFAQGPLMQPEAMPAAMGPHGQQPWTPAIGQLAPEPGMRFFGGNLEQLMVFVPFDFPGFADFVRYNTPLETATVYPPFTLLSQFPQPLPQLRASGQGTAMPSVTGPAPVNHGHAGHGYGPRAYAPHGHVPQASVRQAHVHHASVPHGHVTQDHVTQAYAPHGRVPQARVPQAHVRHASVPHGHVPQARFPQANIHHAPVPQARVPQANIHHALVPQTHAPRVHVPHLSSARNPVPMQLPGHFWYCTLGCYRPDRNQGNRSRGSTNDGPPRIPGRFSSRRSVTQHYHDYHLMPNWSCRYWPEPERAADKDV